SRMICGIDRAHRLAGRVAALLAEHGNKPRGSSGTRPLLLPQVAVDPDPGHLPTVVDLALAHGRDVVLRVTRGDTGLAAGALGQIDGHSPAGIGRSVVTIMGRFGLLLAPPLDRLELLLGVDL